MKKIERLSPQSFKVDHFRFSQDWSVKAFEHDAPYPDFVIMKSDENVESYLSVLERVLGKVERMVELGVSMGGSCAFFAACLEPDLHLGFDISPRPLAALADLSHDVAAHGKTFEYHSGIDQANTTYIIDQLRRLTGEETPQVDLIIDDASHFYEESLASFNALFKHVRAGGIYAIEDWGWAHWQMWQAEDGPWRNKAALSNLVNEILLTHATRHGLIQEIIIHPVTVYVVRGNAPIEDGFDVSTDYCARGKYLNHI